jgi:GxxExxY protein
MPDIDAPSTVTEQPATSLVSERDALTKRIIACAIVVHSALGPGLLESAYVKCLAHELTLTGLRYEEQVPVTIRYKGIVVPKSYRADFLVEQSVIVEVKSVDRLTQANQAQLLAYLKFVGVPVGLLINFNVVRLVQGLQRVRR